VRERAAEAGADAEAGRVATGVLILNLGGIE
jgi:hypothetical protein